MLKNGAQRETAEEKSVRMSRAVQSRWARTTPEARTKYARKIAKKRWKNTKAKERSAQTLAARSARHPKAAS